MAIRTGWRPARNYYDGRKFPGEVRTDEVDIEVLSKPVLLRIYLGEGRPPRLSRLLADPVLRHAALRALDAKAEPPAGRPGSR